MYPPSPVPPPRAPKTGLILGLGAAALVLVTGAALVGLYVTGVIGPAASDRASGEPGEHGYNEDLCDLIDLAAFGPGLSKTQELELRKDPESERLECRMTYALPDDPDGDGANFSLGQLTITMDWYDTVGSAKKGLSEPVVDEVDAYEGDWDEGSIGQRIQDEANIDTEAAFRDSNLNVTVRMAWSGAEFDAGTLLDGVKDISDQAMSAVAARQ